MKIAVMGAGAVGAYFGGRLAQAGHDVTLIARPAHADAMTARGGLQLDSKDFTGIIPLKAVSDASGVAGAEVVLFCVKSADTLSAGREMLPHLSREAAVLCLQNGVDNAERLSPIIAREATPVAVYVAAGMTAPGHVTHHGRGELIIGPSPASDAIARVFTASNIPTTVSDTVRATLWEKLVLNCAYNALSAIPQLPYRRLLAVDGTREVIRQVVDECVAVAAALNITLPADMYARTLALADTMPDQMSSTALDLARGKASEIDYLNGHVVAKGRERGIATPANLALWTIVKLQESAKASPIASAREAT